jgi:hypothetical protein
MQNHALFRPGKRSYAVLVEGPLSIAHNDGVLFKKGSSGKTACDRHSMCVKPINISV